MTQMIDGTSPKSIVEEIYRLRAEQDVYAREQKYIKELGYQKDYYKRQLVNIALNSSDPFITEALNELLMRVKMVTTDLPPDPTTAMQRFRKEFLQASQQHLSMREKMRIAGVDYGSAIADLLDEEKKNGR